MILGFGKTINDGWRMKEYTKLVKHKNWSWMEFSDSGDKKLFWYELCIA